jgi:hypothetical protein
MRDGLMRDVTIHLDGIAGTVLDLGTARILGDGAAEYQTVRLYRRTTGAAGDWRLPPLSRVARVTVEANRADFAAPLTATLGPAYDAGEQILDFLLRP